jgi:hypothetical protein
MDTISTIATRAKWRRTIMTILSWTSAVTVLPVLVALIALGMGYGGRDSGTNNPYRPTFSFCVHYTNAITIDVPTVDISRRLLDYNLRSYLPSAASWMKSGKYYITSVLRKIRLPQQQVC